MVKNFESFIAVGFGNTDANITSLGTSIINTGYNMAPIISKLEEACKIVAEEAYKYDEDEDETHTKDSYLSEVKKCIDEKINEACVNHKSNKPKLERIATDYKYDNFH